ncbi:MAG: cation transporter, partial [Lachnospiraceae bacterium]|nr:cation transporter [Lachnospiraceae bacterium]
KNCQAHVEEALAGVEGVTAVTVDLEAKQAKVICESSVSDETLCSAVAEAGYEAAMADGC